MKESKYISRFQKLANEGAEAFCLPGDFLLVERIPEEELKSKAGLIIADVSHTGQVNTFSSDKPHFARVLMAGAGYFTTEEDEDGKIVDKTVPLEAKPGDIILVSPIGTRYFSRFPIEGYEAHSIGICKESEIQFKFIGEEGYRKAVALLNPPSEEHVA